jgi:hypothetical protein
LLPAAAVSIVCGFLLRLRDFQDDIVILREPLALADPLELICPGEAVGEQWIGTSRHHLMIKVVEHDDNDCRRKPLIKKQFCLYSRRCWI